MEKQIGKLGKERLRFCCSSSISNWREKLRKRLEIPEYSFPRDVFKPVIFFGMYHVGDYLKFILHKGEKKVFWCGSDILNLRKNWLKRWVVRLNEVKHFVENEVEFEALLEYGWQVAEVCPMIFDDPGKYQISYRHSNYPRVFGTYHKGREKEYGVFFHPQIDWFCGLSEKEFNEKIKNYQGCIRSNSFDGFAESLAKSALMGQYQYTLILYPHMRLHKENESVNAWLEELKNKKEPNYEGEKYWRKKLEESLCAVLS